MRVLLLSNNETERCGVAQVGRHLLAAAQQAGVKMLAWHSTREEPVPARAEDFDLIHVNWHAATLGHLGVEHLPASVPVSLFIHEPWSVCALVERAELVIAAEGALHPESGDPKSFKLLLPPCLDYQPQSTWDGLEVTLGASGIRGDGLDWVAGAVQRQSVELLEQDGALLPGEVNPNAWRLCPSSRDPDGWLSDEAEIERLAGCALTVAHYHSGNSGQAYGPMMAIAARRPLLLNHNRMLEHLWASELADEELYVADDVAEGIHQIVRDLREGREKRPFKLALRRSWSWAIQELKEAWEGVL